MSLNRKFISVMCALVLCAAPLINVHAAGGGMTGKVTDAKGAVIAGASVTVTEVASAQTRTATTDAEGRFKIEALPSGLYTVVVAAKGFAEMRRENIKVEESKEARVDVRLEVAALDAGSVQVSAAGLKPNTDPIYQQLRQQASNPQDFTSGTVVAVNNLVLKRDAALFTLRSGEIYFLPPVEGRTVGAVFLGDGEMTLTPPTEVERKSLALFTDEPKLTE